MICIIYQPLFLSKGIAAMTAKPNESRSLEQAMELAYLDKLDFARTQQGHAPLDRNKPIFVMMGKFGHGKEAMEMETALIVNAGDENFNDDTIAAALDAIQSAADFKPGVSSSMIFPNGDAISGYKHPDAPDFVEHVVGYAGRLCRKTAPDTKSADEYYQNARAAQIPLVPLKAGATA